MTLNDRVFNFWTRPLKDEATGKISLRSKICYDI